MKALVWLGPHSAEVRDIQEPEPGDDEVVVTVQLAGMCGSDVTAYKGGMGISRPGAVRGHEFVGVLESGKPVGVNPVIELLR